MARVCFLAIIAALFSACAGDYQPYVTRGLDTGDTQTYDSFSLKRSACFGFCPVYEARLDERDILVFKGERFVAETDGTVSKRLPAGSFNKLISIARDYDFTDFDEAYPNEDGSNCPHYATDMPGVQLSFDARRLDHSVSLYQGCMGFEGRERLDAMIVEIDKLLDLDDLIGPREAFYGAKE